MWHLTILIALIQSASPASRLDEILDGAQRLRNYTERLTSDVRMTPGAHAAGTQGTTEVEVSGIVLHILRDELEAYRKGDGVVYREGTQPWKRFRPEDFDDAQPLSGAAQHLTKLKALQQLVPFHDRLDVLEGGLLEASERTEGDVTVLEARLAAPAIAKLVDRLGSDALQSASAKLSSGDGKITVRLGDDDSLRSLDIVATAFLAAPETKLVLHVHQLFELSKIGRTEVELPEQVEALFAER